MGRDVRFGSNMNVLGTVEAWRPAGTYAVRAEGLDGFLFQSLIGDEIVEVVGGKVCDGAAVGELASRARCAA